MANAEFIDFNYGPNGRRIRKFNICIVHHHFHLCGDGNAIVWQKLYRYNQLRRHLWSTIAGWLFMAMANGTNARAQLNANTQAKKA